LTALGGRCLRSEIRNDPAERNHEVGRNDTQGPNKVVSMRKGELPAYPRGQMPRENTKGEGVRANEVYVRRRH